MAPPKPKPITPTTIGPSEKARKLAESLGPKPVAPAQPSVTTSRPPITPQPVAGTSEKARKLAESLDKSVQGPVADPATLARQNVGLNFQGPVSPEVSQALRELRAKERSAVAVGVPKADVAAIAEGKGDPNRGFLGVGKSILGAAKRVGGLVPDVIPGTRIDISDILEPVGKGTVKVGTTLLSGANPALEKLDLGRRIFTSTVKEAQDALGKALDKKGRTGFSASDWWRQLSADEGIGGGELVSDIKNPYANQLFGFILDVGLDPVTYVSGPGGIAKTAAQRGVIAGGTRTGAKIAKRAAKNQADQFAAALAKKVAEKGLDDAIRIGDNQAAQAAEDAIEIANKRVSDVAKKLAADTPARTMGRTSNQAVAEQVLGIRDEAQKVIDLGTASAGELANAERAVEVLNDAVIANIQKSGLAGIAGPFFDIVKGKRTAAQDVLGVRGGLRIVNPLALFPGGPGPLRATIPGTERLINATGKLLAESRLGVGKTAFGAALLNKATPAGEGGLFGSEDLLQMRSGLRQGKLRPDEAREATRLLQLDQQYRALVNNERKVAAGRLNESGLKDFDKKTLDEVISLRQTAAAGGTVPAFIPGSAQQAASDAIDKIFDYFYDYAAKASGGTGFVPPRRANYFPQMQSDAALRWAEKFPKKAEELAKELNVDRTWFVGNFRARDLNVGDKFFGKVLTQADIDGGITTLNNIARQWGLDFDYFETDVLKVVGKYAQKHAQFSALQKTLGSLPEKFPTMAARKVGDEFVTPKATLPSVVEANPEMFLFFSPEGVNIDVLVLSALAATDPVRYKSFVDDMTNLAEKSIKNVVDKKEFETLLGDVESRIAKIRADIESGAIDYRTAAVASDEVAKEIMLTYALMASKAIDIATIPANRWTEYASIVKKGFRILNDDIIDPETGDLLYKGTAPNIAVRDELADLLRNAERMSDPQFAARARQLALEYTRFSKAWLTARPGFHTRNAISNVFQLIAAGANPEYLLQSKKILDQINKGLEKGITTREIATALVDSGKVGKVKAADKRLVDAYVTGDKKLIKEVEDEIASTRRALIDAIEDAINYSSATGFGQFGEIYEAVGKSNRGVRQVKEVGKVKFKQPSTYKSIPSTAAGKYLQINRKAGEAIENYSRFGLMWDGLSKGLSPAEAAARANKYLIDYSDLSSIDKVAKQIIPFWTFMSRNTPLQLELLWTNPRAFALFSNAKRNIEDEQERYIPGYEKERGVFALKTPIDINVPDAIPGIPDRIQADLIKPGLPFPGGGENLIQGLITEPKKFLASVNPILRAPIEAFITGEKFFTGGKVVPKEWTDQSTNSKLKYLVKEIFTPSSPVQALLRAIPGVGRQKFMEDVFGLNTDQAEPLVQEVNSIFSLFGLPIGKLRKEQQVREIESRIYDLGDRIDAIKAREKKAQEEAQKK